MIKMIDILMVLLFPFIDSIPFTLPRYWIFRDKLRIQFRYIILVQLALSAAYSVIFYYINLGGQRSVAQWTTITRYCFLFIFLAMAFLLIRESFSKLMFTWLLFLSWQLFVLGNGNYIENRFFFDYSNHHSYVVYNIARIIVYLITCPFMLRFFCHMVVEALKIEDKIMWRHFWKIPLFSILFGMLYCTVTDIYAYASWQFLVSRYLMLLGSCYISFVALKVMKTSHRRIQLEEALKYADQNLLTQKKQFEALASHMDEMRRARHDLRQHLTVVQFYIAQNDKIGLSEYIDIYKDRLPSDNIEYFCANSVVNAIVSYYATQAQKAGIEFTAKITYPKDCDVLGTDITVLLGNLLENAVEACKREMADKRFIKLRVNQRGQFMLLILVDNTCVTTISFEDGMPLSSKRDGIGIGMSSVQEIATRYDGMASFKQQDGIFYASVRLMLIHSCGFKKQEL